MSPTGCSHLRVILQTAFATQAQPLKKQFVKQGLPEDFIEALNATVADVQRSAMDSTSS